jgi:predicted anti-sigma-YlaC factor YlaD
MNTILNEFTEAQGGCDCPDIAGRLYAYIDEPINEPAAAEFEDHLLECRDCREFFLTTLKLRREARHTVVTQDKVTGSVDANVVGLAEFRKEYP